MEKYQEENIKEFLLYRSEKEITKPNTLKISPVFIFFSCMVLIFIVTFQLGIVLSLGIISIFIVLAIFNFYLSIKFKKLDESITKTQLFKSNFYFKGIHSISHSIIFLALSIEFMYIYGIRNKEMLLIMIALYVFVIIMNILIILFKIKKRLYKKVINYKGKKKPIELISIIGFSIVIIGFFIVEAISMYYLLLYVTFCAMILSCMFLLVGIKFLTKYFYLNKTNLDL